LLQTVLRDKGVRRYEKNLYAGTKYFDKRKPELERENSVQPTTLNRGNYCTK